MQVLIDYNAEGDAELLFALIARDGWADLLELEFVFFRQELLDPESDDTTVWRLAQAKGMLILTYNRNKDDETSLTATIQRENTFSSLPVLTIANPLRMKESDYRQEVADRLVEILFYLENYIGTGRIFIP